MRDFFPALQDRSVRFYSLGQLASVMGWWMQNITLNLLAYQLSGSAAVLGALNFLLFGPVLVVAPFAGSRITPAIARRTLGTVLASSVALALVLTLLAGTHRLDAPLLLALAAMAGLLGAVEQPARNVMLVSSLADRNHIANAVALNTLLFNLARMVGPAIAAALFAAGPACGFAANALGMSVMLLCIRTMRIHALPGAATARGRLRAAFAYVRADRMASLFLPVVAVVGLFGSSYQTLIPVLADRAFGSTTRYSALFFAVSGAGALISSAVLSSKHSAVATRYLMVISPWMLALSMVGIALAPAAWVAAIMFFLLGACLVLTAPATNSMLQHHAPPELRGSLAGLYAMSFIGMIPFGQLLSGVLAQAFSVRTAFLVLASGLALVLAALFGPRWRRHGGITLDADRI